VKYVAAEFPLEVPGLVLVQTFGRTRIYENTLVRPRAWVEAGPGATPGFQLVEMVEYSPNRLRVRATGPGQLVLSEVMYSGWQAQVDGVAAPLVGVDDLLRSVTLGPGPHEVVVEFWPTWLYAGAAISGLGLLALVAVWRWAK
jgi:hypothetical protein